MTTQHTPLVQRLHAIVEGGAPDKSGRGYVLNLLAESAIEIKGLLAALHEIANLESEIGDSHRYRYAAIARAAIKRVEGST